MPSYQELALALIDQHSTMTLATADDRTAWAAPVYYALHKGSFYFFSNPETRHIREAMASGQAAAAIYPMVDAWQAIRGIQMSGRIQSARPGIGSLAALRAYIKKYPFTKDFFESEQPMDLAGFAKQFKVSFYRYKPELVYYLDNQVRFGFRTEIDL